MNLFYSRIGLQDLTFNITDQDAAPCKRRLVCEVDRLATKYPVVGYAINILRYIYPCYLLQYKFTDH